MGLFDVPFDHDLVRRLLAHVHGHVRRRDVGDLAVQAEGGVALGAVGLPRLDLKARRSSQAAACQELVEAVEPAQAAGPPGSRRPD